jgi:Arc/MetJ-type ribon-helix-helix transcriptional regulator
VSADQDGADRTQRPPQATGESRSDLVRDALRSQALRETLRLLHEDLGPQARAVGWLSEEDILEQVS